MSWFKSYRVQEYFPVFLHPASGVSTGCSEPVFPVGVGSFLFLLRTKLCIATSVVFKISLSWSWGFTIQFCPSVCPCCLVEYWPCSKTYCLSPEVIDQALVDRTNGSCCVCEYPSWMIFQTLAGGADRKGGWGDVTWFWLRMSDLINSRRNKSFHLMGELLVWFCLCTYSFWPEIWTS